MSVTVSAIDHLVINVSDVARSAEWYRKVLGMEVNVFDPGHGKPPRTSLIFGDQKINVRPRDADKVEWFTADHETAGSDDLCFLTPKPRRNRWSRISKRAGSRSRKVRLGNRVPAACCGRSIAATPTAV
jgi:catechol 2,3-dioxygenase-like lactoylglutathione lyase family enzyme